MITQETGFSDVIPSGEGLFGFSSTEEALTAVEAINGDYPRHARAAAAIARDYFSHEVVLGNMLKELDV